MNATVRDAGASRCGGRGGINGSGTTTMEILVRCHDRRGRERPGQDDGEQDGHGRMEVYGGRGTRWTRSRSRRSLGGGGGCCDTKLTEGRRPGWLLGGGGSKPVQARDAGSPGREL